MTGTQDGQDQSGGRCGLIDAGSGADPRYHGPETSTCWKNLSKTLILLQMKTLFFLAILPFAAAGIDAQGIILSNPSASPSEAPGWVWEAFADRVMGGKSELVPPAIIDADGGKALLLAGKVITKGGGFIQVRLKHQDGLYDASGYEGVEIEVDARTATSWYVFLRTKDTMFPWSYYGAPFSPTPQRGVIRIPFGAFKAESTGRKTVRTEYLSSIALVAAYEDFNAYMRIYKVGFYK